MKSNNIYKDILNKYNPKDKRSHSILRFFAEDLNDKEQIKFVEAIFDFDSWILASEISKSSNSTELKKYTENRFIGIFHSWVTNRIEHSSYLSKETKNPYLPQLYSLEFREILFTIRNLGFPEEIMIILDIFIKDCNSSYLKKYFENNFWILVEEYNIDEIEIFFIYFSNKFVENGSLNLSNFIYSLLNNLAYSPKIFNISETFIDNLKKLSDNFKVISYQNKNYYLITVLLIELVQKKKLQLSDPIYKTLINASLNELEKGIPENVDLFKFLKRFSYKFESFDFEIELEYFFNRFKENIEKISIAPNIFKKAIAHHYIKTSEKYFELFLFYLENIPEISLKKNLSIFYQIISDLRDAFKSLLWFNEYLNFDIVTGDILKSVKGGYYIKIDEDLFIEKVQEKKIDLNNDQDFIFQNGTGFLSEHVIKENLELKTLIHLKLGKRKSINSEISYTTAEEKIMFFIIDVNYSSTNKGCTLILAPLQNLNYDFIRTYNIKSFFSTFDLFLISKAHYYLNSKFPFDMRTLYFKNAFNSKLLNDYNFNISEESFWNLLRIIRLDIYELTYIVYKKHEKFFNQLVVAYQDGAILKGTVLSRTNGGLIVSILNNNAFLPGSHIDVKTVTDFEIYIGKDIDLKIIKLNQESKSIIVSHKVILEPKFEKERQIVKESLYKRKIIEGVVKNITSYGVFVDLDGVDGLVHITDLCWHRINHPEDVVFLGQKIRVLILDFNSDKSKIQLGLKQLVPSPISEFSQKVKIGDVLQGKIIQKTDFGIFVEIEKGIEGLVHVSEFSRSNNETMFENVLIGDTIDVVIKTMDIEENKLACSIKRLLHEPWNKIKENYILGSIQKFKIKKINSKCTVVQSKDNIEGYIEKQNYSWNRIISSIPSKFKIDNEIEFVVLGYNYKERKIILGYKQTFPNPWNQNLTKYNINSVHQGIIMKIFENGYSVELENDLVGFVFSDFAKHNVRKIKIGEKKFFKVKKFDSIKQNIVLKLI